MKFLATILLSVLTLTSCGTFDRTIDKGVSGGKELVTHVTEEISELKTETLQETRETLEEMVPELVEQALNTPAVAFLVVSLTFLLGFVVIVAGLLLLSFLWTLFKRWRHPKGCMGARKRS